MANMWCICAAGASVSAHSPTPNGVAGRHPRIKLFIHVRPDGHVLRDMEPARRYLRSVVGPGSERQGLAVGPTDRVIRLKDGRVYPNEPAMADAS